MQPIYIVLIVITGLFILIALFCHIAAGMLARTVTTPRKFTKERGINRQIELEGIDFSYFDKFQSKEFYLPVENAELYCKKIYSQRPSRKWVIISHGFTGSHYDSFKYAKIFLSLGYNCFMYDQRYFGDSSGDFCSMGYFERYDISKIIFEIYSSEPRPDVLCLHGESMGSATVLSALEFCQVDYVVADCGFADTGKFYRQMTRKRKLPAFPVYTLARMKVIKKFGFDPDSVIPIDAVSKTDTPILFIHGKSDSLIDYANSVEMHKACKSFSQLALVDNAEHALSHKQNNEKYSQYIEQFEHEVLKQKGKEQFIMEREI